MELFRGLITVNACIPESHFVISLLRLSDCQSSLGRGEEAVDAAMEAIHIYSKAGICDGHTGWFMALDRRGLTLRLLLLVQAFFSVQEQREEVHSFLLTRSLCRGVCSGGL